MERSAINGEEVDDQSTGEEKSPFDPEIGNNSTTIGGANSFTLNDPSIVQVKRKNEASGKTIFDLQSRPPGSYTAGDNTNHHVGHSDVTYSPSTVRSLTHKSSVGPKENVITSKRQRVSKHRPKTVVKCTERDVLLGRGKRVSEWPGNVYFRQVVAEHRDSYSAAERLQKGMIAEVVVKKIYFVKGRFVREQSGRSSCDGNDPSAVWVKVGHARAIEKACQALRERTGSFPKNNQTFDQSPLPDPSAFRIDNNNNTDNHNNIEITQQPRQLLSKENKDYSPDLRTSPQLVLKKIRRGTSPSSSSTSESYLQRHTSQNILRKLPIMKNEISRLSHEINLYESSSTINDRKENSFDHEIDGDDDLSQSSSSSSSSRSTQSTRSMEESSSSSSSSTSTTKKNGLKRKSRYGDRTTNREITQQSQTQTIKLDATLTREKDNTIVQDSFGQPSIRNIVVPDSQSIDGTQETPTMSKSKLANQIYHANDIYTRFCDSEMIQRLQRFQELYGHTSVPTSWEQDVPLADWCTIQRQIGYEIQIGYRDYNTELSPEQKDIYSQLQSMQFNFTNYVDWHWNEKYDKLRRRIETLSDLKNSDGTASTIDNDNEIKCLYLWLNDQQQKFHKDRRGGLYSQHCIGKLKKLDILS